MRKSLIITTIIVLIFVGIAFGIYYYVISNDIIACTEDARICSDGTAVVRIPPSCEFEACPDEDISIIGNACMDVGCERSDIYAGSVKSDKYYECSCRWAKSVNPENLVCFSSDAEAVADNRTLSVC